VLMLVGTRERIDRGNRDRHARWNSASHILRTTNQQDAESLHFLRLGLHATMLRDTPQQPRFSFKTGNRSEKYHFLDIDGIVPSCFTA
jgi:hypothetical protein